MRTELLFTSISYGKNWFYMPFHLKLQNLSTVLSEDLLYYIHIWTNDPWPISKNPLKLRTNEANSPD